MENFALFAAKSKSGGGGGGGTVTSYTSLSNKPEINSVELSGNKSAADLGLVAAQNGKGLSTNDYTTAEKTKLSGIAAGAEVNVQSDWSQTTDTADDFIKNKPDVVVKSNTAGLLKNDGTVDTTSYAAKVSGAVNGNFAGLSASGNLTDSGKKAADFATPTNIQNVYKVMGKNGAKNLIPYPYGQTSRTDNGVTYTVNADGSVLVNGTATANSTLTLQYRQTPSKIDLKVGESYIVTGGVSAQLSVGVSTERSGSAYYYGYDKGSGLEFTPESGDEKFGALIQVTNGSTVNNVTVYPMIRPASDTDSTYRPYAATNKELTDAIGKFTDAQWTQVTSALS